MNLIQLVPPEPSVPKLETPRLILRGHRLEDFEPMVAIWSDPIVRKHFHNRPFGREDIWAQLLRHFGCWAALGYGMWAIEEKATGAYVGACGVFEVKRSIDSAFENVPEAGWAVASQVHGRGYATEAMGAALAWVDAHVKAPRLFCIITPGNTPSVRVAEKCGFIPCGQTTYKDEPTLLFVRESPANARRPESA